MYSGHPVVNLFRWAEWTLLNTLAVVCAAFVSLTVLPSVAGAIGLEVPDRTISIMMATLVGTLLAVTQWLLVRTRLSRPFLWIPFTFLSWIAPLIILFTIFRPSIEHQQVQIAMVLVSIGVLMGFTQYVLLRPFRRKAPLWIIASVLGWLLLAFSLPIPISNNFELIKVGAIPALITGIPFAFVVCLPSRQGGQQTHAA